MRFLRIFVLLMVPAFLLPSCKKELNLNADWEDVTIVYGIMNQLDSAHYVKITKAFLGPGNALQYAQIPDSSNYHMKMDVNLEAWDGSNLVAVYPFDTTTINDKDSGVFYFPNQLLYVNYSILDPAYKYKLVIVNPQTQEVITSETPLVKPFLVEKPFAFQAISYDVGKNSKVEWTSAIGGKRYQVMVRFFYQETSIPDPTQTSEKYIDWLIVPTKLSKSDEGGEQLDAAYSNDAFYALLHAGLEVNPDLERAARYVQYHFTVAANDLNTYIEVTQPSNSIIQEKPSFSNIENGIGLFSARYVQVIDSIQLSQRTIAEIRTNALTNDLGF
ncbi:MAG: hypothetical protein IH596_01130 [Bacteroidales bacterium]|nr:hypothetical protein [Bacteroidales bacterium]